MCIGEAGAQLGDLRKLREIGAKREGRKKLELDAKPGHTMGTMQCSGIVDVLKKKIYRTSSCIVV